MLNIKFLALILRMFIIYLSILDGSIFKNLELVHPVSGKRIHGRIKNGLELPLRIKSSFLECNYAPVLTKMLVGASTTAVSKLQIMNFNY